MAKKADEASAKIVLRHRDGRWLQTSDQERIHELVLHGWEIEEVPVMTTNEEAPPCIRTIKEVCADYKTASRWVLVNDGAILRVVGLGRKYVRVMHQDGRLENITSDRISAAW
jgi:hypothetical protein